MIAEDRLEPEFYVAGGTLPRDAPSYVPRKADRELLDELRRGKFCYVLTSRQMGKSSLMVRTAAALRQEGVASVVIDLTAIGQNLTVEQWYDGLLNSVGSQLDIEAELDACWLEHARQSPLWRWSQAIEHVILPRIPGRLVFFIDEIDAVRSLPFSADEFFAAIRECYNRRTENPEYRRLTFCLMGVAAPSDLIRDTRTTPFNIGRRIELTDFSLQEAVPLAQGLGCAEGAASSLLQRILYWTDGHPYLTQRLCQSLSENPSNSVDSLVGLLFLSRIARESDDNLAFVRNRILRSEADVATLLDLYTKIRARKRVPDEETNPLCGILKLSGAVKEEDGLLRVRNRIYDHVFNGAWVRAHLPDAEIWRQQQAFRRGVALTGSIAGVVLLVVGSMAVLAYRGYRLAEAKTLLANNKAQEAARERDGAQYLAYVANMNLIVPSYDQHNFDRIDTLLEETKNSRFRGFEWNYWNRLCHLEVFTLKGHSGEIRSVVYSPDGKRIVTGSADRTARVWDAATGRETLALRGHTNYVFSAAFSPDGKQIITGSFDRTARVWDAGTGRLTLTLRGHSDEVNSVAYSPDGKRIVTGSRDGTTRVWDAGTGRETLILKGQNLYVFSAEFSPDGKRIVTGNGDNTARVWDAVTGRALLTLKGHSQLVRGASFSPDGKRIVTASNDGTARVWDAESGRRLLVLQEKDIFSIYSAAFSPDGKRIVTGNADNTARVWDTATGRELIILQGHSDWVYSAAFSPDGRRIVTGNADHTAKVWDAAATHDVLTLKGHGDMIQSVAYSPTGRHIATGSNDHTARVWDANTGQVTLILRGHRDWVQSVAFSPDGKRIATGSGNDVISHDYTAKIWDAATGRNLLTFKGHTEGVASVAFSPDGKRIVTGSYDKTAKVWDAISGRELLTLKGHRLQILFVGFSRDGKRIVSGSSDGTARFWDAATGRETLILNRISYVFSAAFSPDGKRIVTGNGDNTAKVWDSATGRLLLTLRGHSQFVCSVAFSPDGKRIATGSRDTTAKLWDSASGQEVLTLKGHASIVNSVAFSPDGKRIVTGSEDHTARVWDEGPVRPTISQ